MLALTNIHVNYGKVEAVNNITIELQEKEFVCILGANGAGKSTVIRAVSGLKKPSKGEITFSGERIDRFSPEAIAKKGIIQVPENRRIFPYITVFENLLVGAYIIKDKKMISRRLQEVYARFPILAERRKQMGGSLSGGQQQILAFGRALMAHPKLLMLDEPTLGLAPMMVEECAKFAQELNREGVAIILVEQNARLALAISQRAYVMETGSIVLSGDSNELAKSEHVKKAYLGC